MAVDYFLDIEGVEGESKDAEFAGKLQLMSWSWGESNSGSSVFGGGAGSGKVNMQDFSFMIVTGKGSPKLQKFCATGEHIKKAVLSCRKAGGGDQPGKVFLTYTFTDILISSFQISGSSEVPMESISFNYTKVENLYKPQDETGEVGDNIQWSYDLKTNTAT